MKINLCVGEYATTPYCIECLQVQVYCIEELVYCFRENAYLLDLSVLDERLVDWIGSQCRLLDLAGELYKMVRKNGSLSSFVTLIMEYVGLYDEQVIHDVERVIRDGSGLSAYEKRKNQVDYLVWKGKYISALHLYDELLESWKKDESEGALMPPGNVKANILHNKGVVLAHLFQYERASECFDEAYRANPDEEYMNALLAAKRLELSDRDYLSYIAEHVEMYESSLKLEKNIEKISTEFESRPEYETLRELDEYRKGSDRQMYYEKIEEITSSMKADYRDTVNE